MQRICLQKNLDLMTQKVVHSPNNLDRFPTLNAQLCSFLEDFICDPSLVFNGKPLATNCLPENDRRIKKPYAKPNFSLQTKI